MNPADVPELGPLLAAFRRGTKRSKLRLLVCVCPAGHTLVEVFPTGAGEMALWREQVRWARDEAGEVIQLRPPRSEWRARLLPSRDAADELDSIGGACRCSEDSRIHESELRAALDLGRRRVVIRP